MAKKKNKSFVEIKKKDDNFDENIINPLKQYEYIEPQKKMPIKQIFLVIAVIITIILVIILLKLMSNHSNKQIKDTSTNLDRKTNLTLQTTTTKVEANNEQITETLVCSSKTTENGIQFDTVVTAYFNNKKLRYDENYMSIALLNESSKEEFDNYVTFLQMFVLYSIENNSYKIDSYSEENKFGFSIKTTYTKDQSSESSLSYDDDYDIVKQKLIELGHTCH